MMLISKLCTLLLLMYDFMCCYTNRDGKVTMLISTDMQTEMETYQVMKMGMVFERVILHIKGADLCHFQTVKLTKMRGLFYMLFCV